jgi:hypothetical protein
MAESPWTAICARVKEDTLNLQRDRPSDTELFSERVVYVFLPITHFSFSTVQDWRKRISNIKAIAEEIFSSLPRHFQLRTNIRECTQDSFERNFFGSVRLSHLHILFLLDMHLLNTPNEPCPTILDIAEQIICIIRDMVLLRDKLPNSRTSLVWKVQLSPSSWP